MALKEPDPDTQKGLTRLPEDVRNKMGYMKKGGKVKKFQDGGSALFRGLSSGVDAGLDQSNKTPEERALAAGLRKGSPDFKKAVETLSKGRKTPLPADNIVPQNENPIIRKAKDMATSVMSRTPSAMMAKKGVEMARQYPRGSEGESSFEEEMGMKKGGAVKKMASGGKVSSASKRADGCAIRGKTRA